MIDIEAIRQIPRYAGTSPAAQSWLAQRLQRQHVAKGESVFHEGDPCAHFFLVEFGAVKIAKFLESGRELILGIFRDGEAIGEVALIDGEGYPATAIAHEDSDVLLLPRPDYLQFLREFPEAPTAIIRDLTLRMRTLSRRLEDLGGGGVEFRLARVMATLGQRLGRTDEAGLHIPAQLTRQDLADLVGARVETVIRIMSRWQKDGTIRSLDGGFLVPEPERLDELIAAG